MVLTTHPYIGGVGGGGGGGYFLFKTYCDVSGVNRQMENQQICRLILYCKGVNIPLK